MVDARDNHRLRHRHGLSHSTHMDGRVASCVPIRGIEADDRVFATLKPNSAESHEPYPVFV